MHTLVVESKDLALPCFDLVPAGKGDRVVAHWGGRRSDLSETFPSFVTALKSQRHLLSVELDLFEQLDLPVRRPIALSVVTTATDDERVDSRTVSGSRLSDANFEESLPLTCKAAVSLPPLEALVLYGGPGVQEWLSAQGIRRWEYSDVGAEIRDTYEEHFNPQFPLCAEQPPVARIGGWHALWPDDDFYLPREMRLLVWTFQDAEPWYEAFLSPIGNIVLKSRIT